MILIMMMAVMLIMMIMMIMMIIIKIKINERELYQVYLKYFCF